MFMETEGFTYAGALRRSQSFFTVYSDALTMVTSAITGVLKNTMIVRFMIKFKVLVDFLNSMHII